MKFFLGILFSLSLTACLNGNTETGKQVETKLINNDVVKKSIEAQLIETIVNLDEVVKYSKIKIVRKRFSEINFYYKDLLVGLDDSIILQKGEPLQLIQNIDEIDLSKTPCYVFEKIEITGNKAYVLMGFDLTGAILRGDFNYVDGKWIADENLIVGVR